MAPATAANRPDEQQERPDAPGPCPDEQQRRPGERRPRPDVKQRRPGKRRPRPDEPSHSPDASGRPYPASGPWSSRRFEQNRSTRGLTGNIRGPCSRNCLLRALVVGTSEQCPSLETESLLRGAIVMGKLCWSGDLGVLGVCDRPGRARGFSGAAMDVVICRTIAEVHEGLPNCAC